MWSLLFSGHSGSEKFINWIFFTKSNIATVFGDIKVRFCISHLKKSFVTLTHFRPPSYLGLERFSQKISFVTDSFFLSPCFRKSFKIKLQLFLTSHLYQFELKNRDQTVIRKGRWGSARTRSVRCKVRHGPPTNFFRTIPNNCS
mmetsp:Transcript_23304/g.64660  ORF Transcript_23304/g.64660 Transcript_23304/m.64660 type:complete len:144 (+) Transcript_23304:1480-1911(+)